MFSYVITYHQENKHKIMEPKDKKLLLYKLTEAAAEYCYESGDKDFDFDVSISANDGWSKVNELKSKTVH